MYWYNKATKESQWDTPTEVQNIIQNAPAGAAPAAQRTASLRQNQDDFDNDAVQITDENDLGI